MNLFETKAYLYDSYHIQRTNVLFGLPTLSISEKYFGVLNVSKLNQITFSFFIVSISSFV